MFVAIIATSLLGLINPLLLGALFDQVLVNKDYTKFRWCSALCAKRAGYYDALSVDSKRSLADRKSVV